MSNQTPSEHSLIRSGVLFRVMPIDNQIDDCAKNFSFKKQANCFKPDLVLARCKSISFSNDYGTMCNCERPVRSISVPVHSHQKVHIKRNPEQLTVDQRSVKFTEEAKNGFFRGNSSTIHGAVFLRPSHFQHADTTRHSRPLLHKKNSCHSNLDARKIAVSLSTILKPPAIKTTTVVPSLLGFKKTKERAHFHSEAILSRKRADAEEITRYKKSEQKKPRHSCESASDLLKLRLMRDGHATHNTQSPLSQTTIDKAKCSLKVFEERRVKAVTGRDNSAAPSMKPGIAARHPAQCSEKTLLLSERGAEWTRGDAPQMRIGSVAQEKAQSEMLEEDSETVAALGWGTALVDLVYIAAPVAVSLCFNIALSVVPLAFVGSYLGERELAGASVGYFIVSIFVMYPIAGLTFALGTLCSQEFSRDPLSPEMGLILQRGVFINIFFLMLLSVFVYGLQPLLGYFYGVDVTKSAWEFMALSPFLFFPLMMLEAFDKFLNNQMQPHISMIALTVGVILMPFLQLKLTPMGVRYTMVGMVITAWVQLFVLLGITFFKPETRMTLGTWRVREALDWTDIKNYVKLAIPSAIFMSAEASSFGFTVLLCAQLSEADGAAWSSIMNLLFIFSSFSGGISASVCVNMGRCICANQPRNAKRFMQLSIMLVFVISVIDSAVLVLFYNFWMSLFGIKGKSLELARQVLFFLPLFHIADSIQYTFQGIFSGLGKNHHDAVILLINLWCIGIPLSCIFGLYLGYNMLGVCVGITAGLWFETPVMLFVASRIDYQLVCDKFMEYTESDEEINDDQVVFDEEYVKEVLRRSGIPLTIESVEDYDYKRLRPPRRHSRRRHVFVEDDG